MIKKIISESKLNTKFETVSKDDSTTLYNLKVVLLGTKETNFTSEFDLAEQQVVILYH